MDFDKAFESFSNRIQKSFDKKKEGNSVKELVSDDVATKLYKIFKFGGNMAIEDYGAEIDSIVQERGIAPSELNNFICYAGPWYLDMCGFNLPFSFNVIDNDSIYLIRCLLSEKTREETIRNQHLSERFANYLIEEIRRNCFGQKDGKFLLDIHKFYEYMDDHVYITSEPTEYLRKEKNSDKRQRGSFYVKLVLNKELADNLYTFCASFCNYLMKYYKEYYDTLVEKTEKLFDTLANSDNQECVKAMNESKNYKNLGLRDKVKNKYRFNIDEKDKTIDPLYLFVEQEVQRLYDKKIIELSGKISDVDLVSGIRIVKKVLDYALKDVVWKVSVEPLNSFGQAYFGRDLKSREIRDNYYVEEKFVSKKVYRALKRKYNSHDMSSTTYCARLEPLISKISNRDKFKIGFVVFDGHKNLSQDEVVELCYKVLSYLRDNLILQEWSIIEDTIISTRQ